MRSLALAGDDDRQQFANYLTRNQQIYNMIAGQAGLGKTPRRVWQHECASRGNIASNIGAAGNAAASGTVGAANAIRPG